MHDWANDPVPSRRKPPFRSNVHFDRDWCNGKLKLMESLSEYNQLGDYEHEHRDAEHEHDEEPEQNTNRH